MFNFTDDLSELVYVVDMDTYRLLYINRTGIDIFHLENWEGCLCYEVLQGKTSPCEFCTNHMLNQDSMYTWNFYNPIARRHYQLRDKLIEWDGKQVRLEIAFDITELEQQRSELQSALQTENAITRCAKKLLDLGSVDQSLQEVLEILQEVLKPDRLYLFEIRGDRMYNTYELCGPDILSQRDYCQDMPLALIDRWQPIFQKKECVVIENVEALWQESPEEYEVLHHQGICSLIAGPLVVEDRLVGYIGVDISSGGIRQSTVSLLASVSYFISTILRYRRVMDFDALTGLPNRSSYMRDIKKPIGFPAGVIYIDINALKQMNDRFGHQRGDQVLVEAAQAISGIFDLSNCYRVGGDEFVILSPRIEEAAFGQKVRALEYRLNKTPGSNASLGSAWSNEPQRIEDLVLRADEKMYANKKNFYRGKPLTGRYRSLLDDVLGLSKPGKLEEALASGCFSVFYQPKFSIETQMPTGAEALTRYCDKNGRRYPPDQFIPYLEECGTISVLDYYIFEQVCCQMRDWIDSGIAPVPVAVNFSRQTLQQESFVSHIEKIRERHRIPTGLLEIEVTETIEADDRALFYQVLKHLQQRSFRIAIDDFGVRNANLSLFIDIDFDTLKIDKDVVGKIQTSDKTRMMLEALVRICSQMNIHIVAEGVETPGQLALLKALNCEDAQGFLFSRPIPEEAFRKEYLKVVPQPLAL